jgi:hypothetical protein
VNFRRGHRAILAMLLVLAGLFGVTTTARAQFQTHSSAATAGGACTTGDFAFPDPSGYALKCIASVWTIVNQPAVAAGSTGYVQFNSSGVLGASSNLFWNNTLFQLGIGTASPVASLDLSQRTDALALPVGTQGQEPASPINGMIRYSTTANDVEAYIAGAWTTLTTGGSNAAITLGTSAATPDPASSYSATTGEFSPASGVYAISSAGAEKMRVNGTGVGIGTTSPSYNLQVTGTIAASSTIGITRSNDGAVIGTLSEGNTSSGGSLQINSSGGGTPYTSFLFNSVEGVRFQSSVSGNVAGVAIGTSYVSTSAPSNGMIVQGNVGIGTTSPASLLNAYGTPVGTSYYGLVSIGTNFNSGTGAFSGSANGTEIAVNAPSGYTGNLMDLQIGGSSKVSVDQYGNINAGTNIKMFTGGATLYWTGSGNTFLTSPAAATLHIGNNDAASPVAQAFGVQNVVAGTSNTAGANFTINGSQGTGTGAGGNIIFQTAPAGSTGTAQNALASVMTIAAAGNVGIGTTSPQNKLDVNGGVAVGTYAGIAGSSNGIISSGNVGIGTTAPAYLLHVGSPTTVGVVADFQNSSGYCTFSPSANTILTTCTSDMRLKKDIVDAGDALAWLDTMRVRDFTLKSTGERRTGVIAQEMMQVHPEMVRMGATGFYRVDLPEPWKLVKAIQQLKAENDSLAGSLKAANDNIAQLRDEVSELRASFEAYKDTHR